MSTSLIVGIIVAIICVYALSGKGLQHKIYAQQRQDFVNYIMIYCHSSNKNFEQDLSNIVKNIKTLKDCYIKTGAIRNCIKKYTKYELKVAERIVHEAILEVL